MAKQLTKQPNKKPVIAVAIVVVAALIVLTFKALSQNEAPPGNPQASRTKGNPSAKLQIVEYMDFQCPACAKGALFLSDFMKTRADEVFLEVKFFPLERVHSHALRAARYGICAERQGKFWPFHDEVFQHQSEWSMMMNADPYFTKVAADIGLNSATLDQCLTDTTIMDKIAKEKEAGQALGIQSTPTYFINGKLIVGSANLEKELMDYFGRVSH